APLAHGGEVRDRLVHPLRRRGDIAGDAVARRRGHASRLRGTRASDRIPDQLDRLVDAVAVGAMAENADAHDEAAVDGRAREEDAARGIDALEQVVAGLVAVAVAEGDDRQLGIPWELELWYLGQRLVDRAREVELLVECVAEG